mmetsp:Transcript_90554/g.202588  ORF Transcript_90554/g.202588 Transcript_90554/m.202588 type:complete len:117 (-) Transcript_90554:232-582(-)
MGGWGKGKFGGWGKGGGKGFVKGSGAFEKKKRTDSREDDPAGSVRVFFSGFDFGTTDEQFEAFAGQAGQFHAVHWTSKGSAVVVYKKKFAAKKAMELDGQIIDGNTRFVTVKTGDS